MKIIKIFLASSSELESDRKEFEILINRENKKYIKDNVFLELVMWEDFIDAMSATRLLDEYNKAVADCDIFVSLFHTKVGKYTEEEFLKALATFKANGKLLIYTYFKDEAVNMSKITPNIMSLLDLKQKLDDLGHFYTKYADIIELKFKFSEQLTKILPRLEIDKRAGVDLTNKALIRNEKLPERQELEKLVFTYEAKEIKIGDFLIKIKPIPPEKPKFYMAQYLVSNDLYHSFIDENKEFISENINSQYGYLKDWINEEYPQEKKNFPVTNISFEQATAFVELLTSEYEQYSIEIPTYEQWKMAMIADRFKDCEQLSQEVNSAIKENRLDDWLGGKFWSEGITYSRTMPYLTSINKSPPNPFGIHDLLGNAYDMCKPTTGVSCKITLAGGCCHKPANDLFQTRSVTPQEILSDASFRFVINL